ALSTLLLSARTVSAQPVGSQALPALPGIVSPQQQPARDVQSPKGATAVVRGRVLAADTGQPLRKAQVRLISTVPGPGQFPRLTTTDTDGRYEFTEVSGGRYTLTAQKGSYVSLQYGQQRAFEPGKPLEILDGQTIEKVDFVLPRGGVVTGRVLDEYGDPASDVMVAALRYQFVPNGGGRRLMPAGRFSTT